MASLNRWMAALAGATVLGGCTTTDGLPVPTGPQTANPDTDTAALVEGLDQLPPQQLDAGECAGFFWSADAEHRFLAFENETLGYARVFADGQVHEFAVPSRQGSHIAGDLYQRHYVDAARQLDMRLSGTIGERLPDGQRIERSVLSIQQTDGQRMVIPVIGHYACRVSP
ncbi:hypothetical protein [Maricaulis sp.]|uniref:hypothetical protein n=1 Tax=Maricaulis sp. TaxID=1486257 RepID=UPI00260D1099|nr:hypothetical protein [Maricaulis sp.]